MARHFLDSDQNFADQIVSAIQEWNPFTQGNGSFLVVAPGPAHGYLSWLFREVAGRTDPVRTRKPQLGYEGLGVEFVSESTARTSSRGMLIDRLLLHDDISWRTYEQLLPALRKTNG